MDSRSILLPLSFHHIYLNIMSVQIAWSCFTYHIAEGLLHHSPLREQVVNRFVLKVVHRTLAEE